jgi:hypothetical protein
MSKRVAVFAAADKLIVSVMIVDLSYSNPNSSLYSSLKSFSAISVAQEPTNSSLTLQSGGIWIGIT